MRCRRPLFGQEHERGLHALAHVVRRRETELHEDRVDVLLDRALGEHERVGDRAVALAGGDLGEHPARARCATSTSTIFGSITDPPRATESIAETRAPR